MKEPVAVLTYSYTEDIYAPDMQMLHKQLELDFTRGCFVGAGYARVI